MTGANPTGILPIVRRKPPPSPGKQRRQKRKMPKFKCLVCGYIYNPALGDPDSGIKPGTSFDQLPDSWVCPVCGASKEQFEKLED